MGNTLKKVSTDGFMNFQHRPLFQNDPAATAKGTWISYSSAVSKELEGALEDESNESVWTIQDSALYHGDQILFSGDIATRLGGPFIHRCAVDKSIKELRRVANGFFLQDKGDFTLASKPVSTECPDKAILLNSESCHRIFAQLYLLANRDFQVDEDAKIEETFVPVKDTKGLVPNTHPNASKSFFQMRVTDEKGTNHTIIVQQYDFDIVTVENVILHSLQNTDSKVAALLMEEARMSLIINEMTKILCTTAGPVFTRVEVEVDSTTSRKNKK